MTENLSHRGSIKTFALPGQSQPGSLRLQVAEGDSKEGIISDNSKTPFIAKYTEPRKKSFFNNLAISEPVYENKISKYKDSEEFSDKSSHSS